MCCEKKNNPKLKTQIRFGLKDIEILTKTKGDGDSFKPVDWREFIGNETIPKFDAKIKLRSQPDKPPRRKLVASPSKQTEPASGQDWCEEPAMEHQQLRRQRSTDGNVEDGKGARLLL